MSTEVIDPEQFLSFYLDQAIYAFDIRKVKEVIDVINITRVPRVPDFMLGMGQKQNLDILFDSIYFC